MLRLTELERVELIVLVACGVAALIVWAPWIKTRVFRSAEAAGAFFGGQTAAYVFLHLFPEIDESHVVVGDRIYLVILVGFLAFYGADVIGGSIDRRAGAPRGSAAVFWLQASAVWLAAFLVVLTIPDALHERLTFFVFSVVGVSLHIALMAFELSERHPALFRMPGRWLVATGPLAAGAIDLGLIHVGELPHDLLIAVVAGVVLLTVFSSELPKASARAFANMSVGVAIYVAIFFTRPIHVG